jgi:hypothetical protein
MTLIIHKINLTVCLDCVQIVSVVFLPWSVILQRAYNIRVYTKIAQLVFHFRLMSVILGVIKP